MSGHGGQLMSTGNAIYEQRLPRTSERPVMSLLDDTVNVRKSSFSALLQQRLRIPGLRMMGAEGGAAEGV